MALRSLFVLGGWALMAQRSLFVRDALVLGGLPQRTRARALWNPALFDCLILHRPGSQGTSCLFCLMGWRQLGGPSVASGIDGMDSVSRFCCARIL